MSASKLFKEKMKYSYIKDTYVTKIAPKTTSGLDGVTRTVFERNLEENTSIISRKSQNGRYKFTPYMEKLVLKGRGKSPRVISIPTIRDKVTLNILNQILTEVYSKKVEKKLTQSIIEDIKQTVELTEYNYYIKIDIKNFFDSINHDILLEKINRRVKKSLIIDLIRKAIQNPTTPRGKKNKVVTSSVDGVPQGISISNILANIYLTDVDGKLKNYSGIKYFRYVDDIFIVCHSSKRNRIVKLIKHELCDKLKLSLNDKWKEGNLTDGFEYLGYSYTKFKGGYFGFTVKNDSLIKLEKSILKTFKDFRRDNDSKKFIWNLNNRITGFVIDDNKFGWLFFYSQIDDKAVLYHLDWYVQKMCKIYMVDGKLRQHIRRFVKAYFEIVKKRGKSGYIPNSSNISISEKKRILQFIFNYSKSDLDFMSDDDVEIHFKRNLYVSVKDLEKDVQSFS
ncbi:reverse transcriptase domain-containing protein [Paenibacillus taichungensis]|uniref:reverse transcriptase domain-containing protein n=1 Tax=Paenibacillus taichungensis TaxID=484184 RepID=UPI002DBCD49E|nr:reverse transcriptase domain-containing protein [Paenibacillus taichungensis]MEC0106779.1 reverse transcriptase domain-containing protein [Paenibacillus taichungensis]MEC0195291.1 reverse transcriptase domain-containing protein [Paenibacillus taichungensis]